jgi:hypothetical protein
MNPRLMLIALTAVFCAACAGNPPRTAASAQDNLAPQPATPAPTRVAVDRYLEFLDELAAGVRDNEPREFNRAERESHARIDRELRASLQNVENIEQLDQDQKIRVFNLHEELQAVIIGDPKYRVICRRQQTVGTNFRHTTCMTVEELRVYQDQGQDFLRHAFPTMTGPRT